MMAVARHIEIDSFISKYQYLCSSGYEASLTFKSDNGQTRVSFEVNLGFLPPPLSMPPPGTSSTKRKSPAYNRRLERRRDSRPCYPNSTPSESYAKKTTEEVDSMNVMCKPTFGSPVCEDTKTEAVVEDCCEASAANVVETEKVDSFEEVERTSILQNSKPKILQPLRLVSFNEKYGNATYVSTKHERKPSAVNERSTSDAGSLSAIDHLKILTNYCS